MASSSQPLAPFERIRSYPFQTDPEFANGLAIILGHPGTPATEAEMNRDDDLVLQAKCFFFSRKECLKPPISSSAYKSWLASQSTKEPQEGNTLAELPDATGVNTLSLSEPTYPSSFAHVVELITTGQPIPGIQQIPDTVLAGHEISSEKPQRRKPWEDDGVKKKTGEDSDSTA